MLSVRPHAPTAFKPLRAGIGYSRVILPPRARSCRSQGRTQVFGRPKTVGRARSRYLDRGMSTRRTFSRRYPATVLTNRSRLFSVNIARHQGERHFPVSPVSVYWIGTISETDVSGGSPQTRRTRIIEPETVPITWTRPKDDFGGPAQFGKPCGTRGAVVAVRCAAGTVFGRRVNGAPVRPVFAHDSRIFDVFSTASTILVPE